MRSEPSSAQQHDIIAFSRHYCSFDIAHHSVLPAADSISYRQLSEVAFGWIFVHRRYSCELAIRIRLWFENRELKNAKTSFQPSAPGMCIGCCSDDDDDLAALLQ